MMKRGREAGLSLVELMVVLALSALVMLMSLPALDSLFHGTQRSVLFTEIALAFRYSRSEAVKLGVSVSLCPSLDSVVCLNEKQPDWSHGWIVFEDRDGDLRLESHDRVLRVFNMENPGYRLQGDSRMARGTTFRSSGFPEHHGSLVYCDSDGAFGARLELTAVGRLEIEELGACPSG